MMVTDKPFCRQTGTPVARAQVEVKTRRSSAEVQAVSHLNMQSTRMCYGDAQAYVTKDGVGEFFTFFNWNAKTGLSQVIR